MDDGEVWELRRRIARLSAEAEGDRVAASGLEELAGRIEARLDPVIEGFVPTTWSGRAATTARRAAEEARQDLRFAARSLREVADELRASAGLLQWRARALEAETPQTRAGR